jgi:hypothetical protein
VSRSDLKGRVAMSGSICVFIGGAYNAYRIHAILAKTENWVPHPFEGIFAGFIGGAIFFGLPMWGAYAIVSHLAGGN